MEDLSAAFALPFIAESQHLMLTAGPGVAPPAMEIIDHEAATAENLWAEMDPWRFAIVFDAIKQTSPDSEKAIVAVEPAAFSLPDAPTLRSTATISAWSVAKNTDILTYTTTHHEFDGQVIDEVVIVRCFSELSVAEHRRRIDPAAPPEQGPTNTFKPKSLSAETVLSAIELALRGVSSPPDKIMPTNLLETEDESGEDPLAHQHSDDKGITTDLVTAYTSEFREPLLNAEGEVMLARRIEAGVYAEELPAGRHVTAVSNLKWSPAEYALLVADGKRATAQLMEANLALVVSIAKRYVGRGISLSDLIQEGNLGMWHAVEKFDYAKGYKFSTYATKWIRKACQEAVYNQARTIRVPEHVAEAIKKLLKTKRELLNDLDREPSPDEVATELDETPEKVADLESVAAMEPHSLEIVVGEAEVTSFAELIEDVDAIDPFEAAYRNERADRVKAALGILEERDKEMALLHFGYTDGVPRTFADIGSIYGVTGSRVAQIFRQKILPRLRRPDITQSLLSFYQEDE